MLSWEHLLLTPQRLQEHVCLLQMLVHQLLQSIYLFIDGLSVAVFALLLLKGRKGGEGECGV